MSNTSIGSNITPRILIIFSEKKVDLINDDLVQVRHDLNDIVNNVTCHMESYAEKNARLEEEIFKTVRADLKKFELSSREASDEATKQLQSHMNSVQAITDKKLETVGKEVKELNESVTHMTQVSILVMSSVATTQKNTGLGFPVLDISTKVPSTIGWPYICCFFIFLLQII